MNKKNDRTPLISDMNLSRSDSHSLRVEEEKPTRRYRPNFDFSRCRGRFERCRNPEFYQWGFALLFGAVIFGIGVAIGYRLGANITYDDCQNSNNSGNSNNPNNPNGNNFLLNSTQLGDDLGYYGPEAGIQRFVHDDLTFTNDIAILSSVGRWQRTEVNSGKALQIVLHADDVIPYLIAYCNFSSPGGDALFGVTFSKSATETGQGHVALASPTYGLSLFDRQLIKNENAVIEEKKNQTRLSLVIHNYNNNKNINIQFWAQDASKQNYTEGNTISCDFVNPSANPIRRLR